MSYSIFGRASFAFVTFVVLAHFAFSYSIVSADSVSNVVFAPDAPVGQQIGVDMRSQLTSALFDLEVVLREMIDRTPRGTVAGAKIALSQLPPDDYGSGEYYRSSCPNLTRTLQRGARDASTGGQVSELQIFLADHLGVDEETLVSGYFGANTQRHVIAFQKKYGLPAYGIAGSLTRAKIAQVCSGSMPISESSIDLKVAGLDGPISIQKNTIATVSWAISGMSYCELRGGRGSEVLEKAVGSGSREVRIDSDTTFSLKCSTIGGATVSDRVLVRTTSNAYGPTCTYASGNSLATNDIAADANTTFESCQAKCVIVRDEKFGRNDSGVCTFFNSNGIDQSAIINPGTLPTPAGITVTAPNGGEQWELSTMNSITWQPYSYNPDVNPSRAVNAFLEKKNSDGTFTTLGSVIPSGKASIHWITGFANDNNMNERLVDSGSNYYIRVVNNETGASDRSDGPFTILPTPISLTVDGSTGPVTVKNGQLVTVKWSATSGLTGCYISGTFNGGYPTNVSNSGSMSVRIDTQGVGPTTFIHIGCTQASVVSNDPYPIDTTIYGKRQVAKNVSLIVEGVPQPLSSIRVLSPNGGEQIRLNEPHSIEWSQTGVKSVSIAVYKNDQWLMWLEKDYMSTCTSCAYRWVPSGIEASLPNVYKIYITGQKADGSGYVDDKSDAPFAFTGLSPTGSPRIVLGAVDAREVAAQFYDMPANTQVVIINQTTGARMDTAGSTYIPNAGSGGMALSINGLPAGTYYLRAQNYSTQAYIAQTVSFTYASNQPATVSLTANGQHSLAITQGENYTLAWSSSNASSCTISESRTDGYPNGTTVIAPNTSSSGASGLLGVYTFTCKNAAGQTTTDTVTITPFTTTVKPTVSLTANGQTTLSINTGVNYTLAWRSSNASSCTITENRTDNYPNGTTIIVPNSTSSGSSGLIGTYTFTCTNAAGSSSAQVTITAAPVSGTCTYTPGASRYGDKMTITTSPSTIKIEGGQSACSSWCSSQGAEAYVYYTCAYNGATITQSNGTSNISNIAFEGAIQGGAVAGVSTSLDLNGLDTNSIMLLNTALNDLETTLRMLIAEYSRAQ